MVISGIHPIYATASIGLLIAVADLLRRVVPFYRRELRVEAATRLTPLDGLRGILCFSVMYHHASITHGLLVTGRWEPTASVFYVLLGQTSVAMFFCITAFLFWTRAINRQGEISPFPFLRGRWFRIVPLYLFTCAAVLWTARKQIHWSHHDVHLGLVQMALMGLQRWPHLGKVDINMINGGVTWTLQYEWAFYLALPALALLVRGGMWRIMLLLIGWWLITTVDPTSQPELFFLTGILAAHVARWQRAAAVLRTFYVSIFVVGLGVAMPLLVPGGYGWLALLLTTLIFIPIACGNSLFGILNLPGLRLMGTISFSVYLLHGIFLLHCRPLLKQGLLHGDVGYCAAVFGVACCVLVFCSITYRFIEWPAIQFEKRFRSTKR